jgi:hypothetical protein
MSKEQLDARYREAYQLLHYQLVASAKAVQIGHAIDSTNMIGCMLSTACAYPMTCDPEDILKTEHSWENAIYYCGDVHVFGSYSPFAKRLWTEHGCELDITEEDEQRREHHADADIEQGQRQDGVQYSEKLPVKCDAVNGCEYEKDAQRQAEIDDSGNVFAQQKQVLRYLQQELAHFLLASNRRCFSSAVRPA